MSETKTVHFDLTGDNSSLKNALDDSGKAMGKLDDETKKSGKSQKGHAKAADANGKKLDYLTGKLGISSKGFEAMTGMTAGAALGLAAVAAAAVATATAMFSLADANSVYVDEIANLTAQSGLSSETLIGLDLAAGRAGVTLEALETGLRGLTKRMGDAHKDGGTAAEIFTDLGLSLADIERGSQDSEFGLRRTLDAISQLPSEAEKASAAMDVFGGRGAKLVAVLSDGSAGLDEMTARAKELGLVIGEDNAEASAEMDRAMTDLNASVQAFKNSMGTEATEAVVSVIDAMTKLVVVARTLGEAYAWVMETTAPLNPAFWAFHAVLGAVELAAAGVTAVMGLFKGGSDDAAESTGELKDELFGLESAFRGVAAAKAAQEEEEAAWWEAWQKREDEKAKAAEADKKRAEARRKAAVDEEKRIFEETTAIWDEMALRQKQHNDYRTEQEEEAAAERQELLDKEFANTTAIWDSMAAAYAEKAAADALLDEEAQLAQEALIEGLIAAAEQIGVIAGMVLDQFGAMSAARAADLEEQITLGQEGIDAQRARLQASEEAEAEYRAAVRYGDIGLQKALEASGAMMTEKEKERLRAQIQAARDTNNELKDEKAKYLRNEFLAQKASELLSITMSTAAAVMAAAPNLIAMGAMGVTGAVQGAIVAAQQPPEFHAGGRVAALNRAPDEVDARVLNDEFVANKRLAKNERAALEEGNRTGTFGGSGGGTHIYIGNEAVTDYIVQEMDGDGELGRRTRAELPTARGAYK